MELTKTAAHEAACAKLLNRFAYALDAYDYTTVVSLFTDDAEFAAFGTSYKGVAGLKTWLAKRDTDMVTRHIVSNVIIDLLDDKEAVGYARTAAYRVRGWRGKEPAPMANPVYILDYKDRFVRDPKRGWLFSRREAHIVLAGVEQRQWISQGVAK